MNQTDFDLKRRVVNFLHARNVADLRRVEVAADRGLVTLRGRLQSFYHKQLCLNCATRVAGVVRLVDELDVTPEENVALA